MKNWKKYLKAIDRLGIPPTLNINGDEKFNSICGSLVTMSLFGFCVWVLVLLSNDMINKNNPHVVISNSVDDIREFVLGPETFNIGLAIGNPHAGILTFDPTIVTMSAKILVTPELAPNGSILKPAQIFPVKLEVC